MVEFLDQKIAELQATRNALQLQIAQRKADKEKELAGRGGFSASRDELIQRLGSESDKAGRELQVARDLQNRFRGQTISKQEAQREFQRGSSEVDLAVSRGRVRSRSAEDVSLARAKQRRQQKAQTQERGGFTGRIEESFKGKPQGETFLIEGQEVSTLDRGAGTFQPRGGFTGRIEESFQGTPQRETFLIEGQEVATLDRRAGTFQPRGAVAEGGRARLQFDTQGQRQVVQLSPAGIIEERFKIGEADASDLLLGGGGTGGAVGEAARSDLPRGEQQFGGVLVTGAELGIEAEPQQIFEVAPRRATRTEILAAEVEASRFGETRLGQNLVRDLKLTALSIAKDRQLIEFERTASIKEISEVSGLPGAIRSGFFRGGAVAGKGLEKLGVPEDIAKGTGRVLGDIALFGVVLAPVSATTVQIERQLFEVSRVKVAGVTKTTTRAGVKSAETRAIFQVERAGRVRKGFIQTKTFKKTIPLKPEETKLSTGGIVKVTQNVKAIVSKSRGREFTTPFQIPTGKRLLIPKKVFAAGEISKVVQRGKIFITRGEGVLRTTTSRVSFETLGVSTRLKDVIFQAGKTTSLKGTPTISAGIFKVVSKFPKEFSIRPIPRATLSSVFRGLGRRVPAPSVFFKNLGRDIQKSRLFLDKRGTLGRPALQEVIRRQPIQKVLTPSEQALQSASIQATRSAISQVVKSEVFVIPPRQPINLLFAPIPSPLTPRLLVRRTIVPTFLLPSAIMPTIQTQFVPQVPRQEIGQVVGGVARVSQGEIQRVTQLPVQLPQQRVIQKVTQIPAQAPTQSFIQRIIQRQRLITTGVPFVPPPRIDVPRIPPPFFKQKRFKQPELIGNVFNVFGRRFGRFNLIGRSRDPLKAVAIGKHFASTTLGVTFKIPKFKGTKIEGFRTKREDGDILFIEPRSKRLSTGSEVKEIQSFLKNSVKGGRR